MAPAPTAPFQDLFGIRLAIARLGESDAFGWWSSHALTEAGEFALPRIFRRSPALAAAHLSLMAARLRHDQGVPKEPLVHLFNLGEAFEGAFERWLIERKAQRWQPDLPAKPAADSVAAALVSFGIDATGSADAGRDRILLGAVRTSDIESPVTRNRTVMALAGAYAASGGGRLVIPYFRIEA